MSVTRKRMIAAACGGVIAASMVAPAFAESPFSLPRAYLEHSGPVTNAYGIAGAPADPFATFIDGVRCHYEYRVYAGGRQRVKVCD